MKQTLSKYALLVGLTLAVPFGFAPGAAKAADEVCNPVITASSGVTAIVATSGYAVTTASSAPCPAMTAAPAAAPMAALEPLKMTLAGVAFDFNKATIKPKFYGELDQFAGQLANRAYGSVTVSGHTDSVGGDAYNLRLSKRRAEAVAAYLAKRGVDGSKMTVQGFGKTQPIADNKTKAGQAQNRRVEVVAQ